MQLFSTEIWKVLQLLMDLLWVVLIVYELRKLRSAMQGDFAERSARHVMKLLAPLLKDAESTAKTFEMQIKEKNRLIKRLNEKLDERIASMNLLLNRADNLAASAADQSWKRNSENVSVERDSICEQHQNIFELYRRGNDTATIAKKLSLSKGEIDLVLDLKKKFLKLGQKA